MVKEHKRSHLTARALAQHAQRLAEEHPDPEQILQRRDVNDSMTRRERERGRYVLIWCHYLSVASEVARRLCTSRGPWCADHLPQHWQWDQGI